MRKEEGGIVRMACEVVLSDTEFSPGSSPEGVLPKSKSVECDVAVLL
jgi:hypothetical protein